MSRSESLKRAQEKYQKKCRYICLRFNTEEEGDLLDVIEAHANKNGYIKELIRIDMMKY